MQNRNVTARIIRGVSIVRPRINSVPVGMTFQIEHPDRFIPYCSSFKFFFDIHTLNVIRFCSM